MRTRIAAAGLALGALVALGGAATTVSAQNADQNKAMFTVVVKQVFNAGDLALVDDLVAKNVTENGAPLGREAFKAMVKDMRAKAAGRDLRVDDIVTDGDKVIGRVTETSDAGDAGSQIIVLRIHDGLVTEHWSMADAPGLRRQFGLRASAPAAASAN